MVHFITDKQALSFANPVQSNHRDEIPNHYPLERLSELHSEYLNNMQNVNDSWPTGRLEAAN